MARHHITLIYMKSVQISDELGRNNELHILVSLSLSLSLLLLCYTDHLCIILIELNMIWFLSLFFVVILSTFSQHTLFVLPHFAVYKMRDQHQIILETLLVYSFDHIWVLLLYKYMNSGTGTMKQRSKRNNFSVVNDSNSNSNFLFLALLIFCLRKKNREKESESERVTLFC